MSTTAVLPGGRKPDKDDRFVAVLINKATGKPLGVLVKDMDLGYARGYCKYFNRRIRRNYPDRKAVAVPVL
jgi:hypothetical protein